MISTIEEYLSELKKALKTCDKSTIQDALSDAEEYLWNALNKARETNPLSTESESLPKIIAGYGSPEDVAEAYSQTELRITPYPAIKENRGKSRTAVFWGVFTDPRAWGALLYGLFALVTGIIYFTWAAVGLSLSLGLSIIVVGLFFTGVFLLSTRGLALLEGRIVEALLGTRMPRRPIFSQKGLSLWGRYKSLVTDKYTWLTLVYMIFQLFLGIFYFSLYLILITTSIWLILRPVVEIGLGQPAFTTSFASYYTPLWLLPFAVIIGLLLLIMTMHLAKALGKMHGKLAKALLVRK